MITRRELFLTGSLGKSQDEGLHHLQPDGSAGYRKAFARRLPTVIWITAD